MKLLESVNIYVIGWLLLMSLILLFIMWHDKRLAIAHKRRYSETLLFVLALAGGALGGTIGMHAFHHKTKHKGFLLGFPFLALLQWALPILLIMPE